MPLREIGSRVKILDTRRVRLPEKRRDDFYGSAAWRALIADIIKERGRRCQQCGRTCNAEGAPIRVFGDHIIELKDGGAPLDRNNIKVLCGSCHTIKTNAARAERAAKAW